MRDLGSLLLPPRVRKHALSAVLLLAACSGKTSRQEHCPSTVCGVTSGSNDAAAGSGASAGSAVTSGGSGGEAVVAGGSGTPSDTVGGSGGSVENSEAGSGGSGGSDDVTLPDYGPIKESLGCGTEPAQALNEFVLYTIVTTGVKDADATGKPGPWQFEREYYVWLPPEYDPEHAYPVVVQGPGCGGDGTNVYPLTPTDGGTPGVNGQVIRVGLTPPPDEIQHVETLNQGCFDDKEGDDSVEWPFYEGVMDTLRASFCIDENRVFASGHSSGGWLADELGCKYSGHAEYPIRGIAVNMGGLPTDPAKVPTCSTAPMSGIWIHEQDQATHPFTGNMVAISRAMAVNGCTIGTNFDDTMVEDYPIGNGLPADTCKKVMGCPDEYPLVVCELPGTGHGSHDETVNPGFSTYFQSFFAP